MRKNILILVISVQVILLFHSAGNSTDLGRILNRITSKQLQEEPQKWIVLDARPIKDWNKSHIRGSIPFSWESYTETDQKQIPYRTFPPERIADSLGRLGITENSAIAVYGDADESWGGEGWVCWVLEWIGHKGAVALLDGGIKAWSTLGYPLESVEDGKGAPTRALKPVSYTPHPHPEMIITAEEIHAHPEKYILIDTRSTLEWFKGHLPGAVHIPWEKFYSGKERSALNREGLVTLLADNGVDTGKLEKSNVAVVYYCTGGIRSGYAWTVHKLSKISDAMNFEGGTAEWDKVYP